MPSKYISCFYMCATLEKATARSLTVKLQQCEETHLKPRAAPASAPSSTHGPPASPMGGEAAGTPHEAGMTWDPRGGCALAVTHSCSAQTQCFWMLTAATATVMVRCICEKRSSQNKDWQPVKAALLTRPDLPLPRLCLSASSGATHGPTAVTTKQQNERY